ncbi:MAG: iron chelate uptake ABC transporter family permease subunit [Inhella sp.]
MAPSRKALFRNPLADPYLLGSASGAGLGVVLVMAGATLGRLQPQPGHPGLDRARGPGGRGLRWRAGRRGAHAQPGGGRLAHPAPAAGRRGGGGAAGRGVRSDYARLARRAARQAGVSCSAAPASWAGPRWA